MAVAAFSDPVFRGKLACVRIGVAPLAIFRRSCKLNLVRIGKRLVALAARRRSMRANQSKFCFRMVEAANVDPRSRVVARFAAKRRAVGAFLRHAILEFSLVRIGVAGRACAVRKMKRQNLVRSSPEARFMALRASDGHVRSSQLEASVLMLGNGEGRAVKIFHRVTIFAAIQMRSGGKLLVMCVLVAIEARGEFHFVESILPRRDMAFVARDGRVLSLKRIM